MICFWSNLGDHLGQMHDTKTTSLINFHIISRYVKLCTVKLYKVKKTGTKPAAILNLPPLPLPHTFISYEEITGYLLKLLQKFPLEHNQHGKYQPELLQLCHTLRKYSKWSVLGFNTCYPQVLSFLVLWLIKTYCSNKTMKLGFHTILKMLLNLCVYHWFWIQFTVILSVCR